MNKVYFAILFGLFSFLPTVAIYAQTPNLKINGEMIVLPAYAPSPILINDRAFVPLFPIVEQLGFIVEWRDGSQTAILSRPENTIMITLDSYSMTSMGDSMEIERPAQLINNHIMIPLRTISEATGLHVQWYDDGLTVDIQGYIPVRDPSPTVQREIEGIPINVTPEELVNIMAGRGVAIEREYNTGYVDHLGGHSFYYNAGSMWISFDSAGGLEIIANLGDRQIRTANGVGVGDSRDRVIEVYGNNFTISPFGPTGIRYFDGETHMSFGFSGRDDTVASWSIGTVSADEDFLRHFGF